MKAFLTLLLGLIYTSLLYSQIDYQNGQTITVKGPFVINGITVDNSAIKTANVRFANPLFTRATINKDSVIFNLRYNIFQDEIEFLKDGKVYFLNKEENKTIRFIDEKSVYTTKRLEGELHYVKLLSDQNIQLYAKESVEFEAAKIAKTQFDVASEAAYKRKNDVYYLSFDGKEFLKIPRGKSAFYKLFENKAEKVKKYIKSNKLDIRKEDDLIQIITYVNTI